MFDPRCEELARVFLDGYPPIVRENELAALAQAIQDAIEGHLGTVDDVSLDEQKKRKEILRPRIWATGKCCTAQFPESQIGAYQVVPRPRRRRYFSKAHLTRLTP